MLTLKQYPDELQYYVSSMPNIEDSDAIHTWLNSLEDVLHNPKCRKIVLAYAMFLQERVRSQREKQPFSSEVMSNIEGLLDETLWPDDVTAAADLREALKQYQPDRSTPSPPPSSPGVARGGTSNDDFGLGVPSAQDFAVFMAAKVQSRSRYSVFPPAGDGTPGAPVPAQSTTLEALNAQGDDRSLATGNPSDYLYRVRDVMVLTWGLRKQAFSYVQQGRQSYSAKMGEEYSAVRENEKHVFVGDPAHHLNFETHLLDEMKKISGTHEQESMRQRWQEPPGVMIFPVLTGGVSGHWCCIRVTVDYVHRQASILWDDPFGDNAMLRNYQSSFKEAVQKSLAMLFEQFGKQGDRIEISEVIKSLKQQMDGASCGPIMLSNMRDYVDPHRSNETFASGGGYSFRPLNTSQYEEQIAVLRAGDTQTYLEISGEQAVSQESKRQRVPEKAEAPAAAPLEPDGSRPFP